MDYFKYIDGRLFCEEIDLYRMSGIKTPFYLYSWNTFKEHFLRFQESFREVDPLICFAIKTCNNLAILKGLARLGAGMDIVSGGELFLSSRAGVPADKVVYAGVGKTAEEIELSIDNGIGFFNVESEPEFIRIEKIARCKNKVMNALLRVNPDEYDKNTHDKTTTGKKGGKFGIDLEYIPAFFEAHGKSDCLKLTGIHIHIGSPIYSAEPYTRAITKMINLIGELKSKGFPIKYLDIGGGYAADYEDGASPSWDEYSESIVPLLKPLVDSGIKIIMEPGRTISANAGILVTSVQYVKRIDRGKNIIITDTGMHHLIRPALYSANHFIWPVNPGKSFSISERRLDPDFDGLAEYDVAGPICESSDYLAKGRKLPPVAPSDRLAVFTAGAYGIVMSSQYNAQPRPAEYMVDGDRITMIREKENYGDLISKQCNQAITLDESC
jgi:diaminopimelate decarboxylase